MSVNPDHRTGPQPVQDAPSSSSWRLELIVAVMGLIIGLVVAVTLLA